MQRATEAMDVEALRAAVSFAKRGDVRLEESDGDKRWIVKELADAYEALRDAEAKADEDARRRTKAAERRRSAVPRIDPLGSDRYFDTYWVFPRDCDDPKNRNKAPTDENATAPLRVWRRRDPRSAAPVDVVVVGDGTHPTWTVFVGDRDIRCLANSFVDRGVRERDLKAALHDLLPPVSDLVDTLFIE